jgi:hypothetical protein
LSLSTVLSFAPSSTTEQEHHHRTTKIASNMMKRVSSSEKLYKAFRKHESLFGSRFQREWLHGDMVAILDAFAAAPDHRHPEDLIPEKLKVEIPNVYSFNVFTQEFLQVFNEEIENFYEQSEKHDIPVRRPNSMNNYGVIVNEIGMQLPARILMANCISFVS